MVQLFFIKAGMTLGIPYTCLLIFPPPTREDEPCMLRPQTLQGPYTLNDRFWARSVGSERMAGGPFSGILKFTKDSFIRMKLNKHHAKGKLLTLDFKLVPH